MSRTHRKSYLNEYSNVESYIKERHYPAYWRPTDADDDRKYWEESSRDGSYDYGRHKLYRQMTNDIIRAKNRRDLKKVLDDPEQFDSMNFATKEDGKFLLWAIW